MTSPTDAQLIEQLDSADESLRAAAAVELAARGHPRALEASLRTLDDAAEIAHADTTPAVWSLATIGLPALRALLDAIAAEAPMTRLHAARAAMEITRRRFGHDSRAWPDGAYPPRGRLLERDRLRLRRAAGATRRLDQPAARRLRRVVGRGVCRASRRLTHGQPARALTG